MSFGREDFVLTEDMKREVERLAREVPHEETCGFIHKDGSVVRWQNTFVNPAFSDLDRDELVELMNTWQIKDVSFNIELPDIRREISRRTGIGISARDRIASESKGIAAVWHSHCLDSSPGMLTFEDNPSLGIQSDITQSKLQRLPYVLYHVGFDEWDMYDPYNLSPYPLKRVIQNPANFMEYERIPYCWNRADCLEIPRSVLWGMFGIDLGIYLRSQQTEYMEEGWQRYVEGFPKVGFQNLPLYDTIRFKAGDCLLMQLPGATNLHHLAVCVDEKQQRLLHVFEGRVSEVEHIAKWRRFVRVVFRHCSQC